MSDDNVESNDAEAVDDATPELPADELLFGCPTNTSTTGEALVHCTPEQLTELATALRDDGYSFLIDLCGVDYLTHPGRVDLPASIGAQRFEVVVSLLCPSDRRRVRIRVQVPAGEPVVPSLFDLWAGSEALERETYDMFGIEFTDHPDHTRILMPEDWNGHPLRKDYDIGAIPVQFKASNVAR